MVDWLYVMTLGKDAFELIKAGALLPAQEKLVELRGLLVEVRNENITLKEQKQALERELAEARKHGVTIEQLEKKGNVYLDPTRPEEPYCLRCIEVDGRPVHLLKTERLDVRRRVWHCAKCKTDCAV